METNRSGHFQTGKGGREGGGAGEEKSDEIKRTVWGSRWRGFPISEKQSKTEGVGGWEKGLPYLVVAKREKEQKTKHAGRENPRAKPKKDSSLSIDGTEKPRNFKEKMRPNLRGGFGGCSGARVSRGPGAQREGCLLRWLKKRTESQNSWKRNPAVPR